MEDKKGDMARRRSKGPLLKKHHRISEFTVMIIGRAGKFRSFKMSSRFLIGVLLCAGFYFLASVFFLIRYFDESRSNSTRSAQLEQIEHELMQTKRAFYRSKQRLALLEDYICGPEEGQEDQEETTRTEAVSQGQTERNVESGSVADLSHGVRNPPIDIADLSILQEGPKLTVCFKLVNKGQEETPVAGYVHMIAVNTEVDPPFLRSYPKTALEHGIPTNHKGGQRFFIRRFKTIRGEYLLDQMHGPPSLLKVLIYDQPGTLILQRELEVKNVS